MARLRTPRRGALSASLLIPALFVFLAACDSADPLPADEVTIQGTVAATADHGQQPGPDDAVEGATVTAATVGAGGQLTPIGGQAVTGADGTFTFTTTARPEPIRLEAQTADGFRTATILESGSAGAGMTVHAPTMNIQSTAAADVYLEAHAAHSGVTVADAALHVSPATASAIHAGDLAVAPVAGSVAATGEAGAAFAMHADGGAATQELVDDVATHRRAAYAQFRQEISAATSAEARTAALNRFFDAYGEAYSAAGMSPLHAAFTATAASGAGARFTDGATAEQRFGMTHFGRMGAAVTVAQAVEAEFQGAGATQAQLNTLAEARTTYLQSLRAATTDAEITAAATAYRDVVRDELAAHANVPAATVDAAFEATAQARAGLDAAVAGAATGTAVADAYTQFYGAATPAAQTALGIEGTYGGNIVAATAGL